MSGKLAMRQVTSRQSAYAFTVIELIVVVGIIAVVSAIAIPRFASSLTRNRVEAAAKRIATDIALVRRLAEQTSASQSMIFDVAANSYTITGLSDSDHPDEDYSVDLTRMPYEVTLTTADLGGDATIIFDGYGVPDSGGDIIVRAGHYAKRIEVSSETDECAVFDVGQEEFLTFNN